MTAPPTIFVQTPALRESLGLEDLPVAGTSDADNSVVAWLLYADEAGLALKRDDGLRIAPEFEKGRGAARARESSLAGQPIAKALGIARLATTGRRVTMVDATAGFGVDAWQAAALGANVLMLERHPVMHALLRDALHRASASDNARVRELAGRVTLEQTDAVNWLQTRAQTTHDERPMLVYLDPMYPARIRRARSRKDIETLHRLVPAGDDDGLLDAALAVASHRVVVKRPSGAPLLNNTVGAVPEAITAPNTRWDRYVV